MAKKFTVDFNNGNEGVGAIFWLLVIICFIGWIFAAPAIALAAYSIIASAFGLPGFGYWNMFMVYWLLDMIWPRNFTKTISDNVDFKGKR